MKIPKPIKLDFHKAQILLKKTQNRIKSTELVFLKTIFSTSDKPYSWLYDHFCGKFGNVMEFHGHWGKYQRIDQKLENVRNKFFLAKLFNCHFYVCCNASIM